MKYTHTIIACLVMIAGSLVFQSCKKESRPAVPGDMGIPERTLLKIKELGYSTFDVKKTPGGYIAEGDIFLSDEALVKTSITPSPLLRIAKSEQYRTNNLITGLPRVITISVTNLPAIYATATDIAISRYNALGLQLTFQRVAGGGQVNIEYASLGSGVLGRSAGFPNSSGNPPSPIQLNADANGLGSSPDVNYLATVIAHEIGHTIGFRHTDYFNRTYSCGWSPYPNEGDAGVGAINIPGTPAAEDPNSWMLACIGSGSNRPFNNNDIIALNYLYNGGGTNPVPDGTYKIISVHSGKALDVYNASVADGGIVVQWTYAGVRNQQWVFTYLGNGFYKIASVHSGKVLDVYGAATDNGGEVVQWAFAGVGNQQWKVEANGDGSFRLLSRHSNKALDVYGASQDNGGKVVQWTYAGVANQRWYIQPI
ncbi:M57 family metalloprotease [Chitinophaga nivalis]|uniref:M57 family metalloprotease n=1 Tax=Chitinophaga nivalis TaxID=2991709 RepID=A0ABT3IQK1_9BACT|nr:M57 family metalloprotease [Chitinophaga nivalis]MCW3464044.1 M57 family metalloprotease [Chitinophaga nivalis]MCW3486266.1 M57 family metalloprotease [Chitinophaga nivalis]